MAVAGLLAAAEMLAGAAGGGGVDTGGACRVAGIGQLPRHGPAG